MCCHTGHVDQHGSSSMEGCEQLMHHYINVVQKVGYQMQFGMPSYTKAYAKANQVFTDQLASYDYNGHTVGFFCTLDRAIVLSLNIREIDVRILARIDWDGGWRLNRRQRDIDYIQRDIEIEFERAHIGTLMVLQYVKRINAGVNRRISYDVNNHINVGPSISIKIDQSKGPCDTSVTGIYTRQSQADLQFKSFDELTQIMRQDQQPMNAWAAIDRLASLMMIAMN